MTPPLPFTEDEQKRLAQLRSASIIIAREVRSIFNKAYYSKKLSFPDSLYLILRDLDRAADDLGVALDPPNIQQVSAENNPGRFSNQHTDQSEPDAKD